VASSGWGGARAARVAFVCAEFSLDTKPKPDSGTERIQSGRDADVFVVFWFWSIHRISEQCHVGRHWEIRGLVVSIVTLLAMDVAVAQDRTWKECELADRDP
jgi:hypothetical protein